VFVYGTLKRGGRFHDRHCAGVVAVEEATVRGTLGELGGYPMLDVFGGDVLAVGTAEPLADVRVQEATAARSSSPPFGVEVRGELLVFDDPATRLPALDELEGFRPGRPSLYERVLIAARLVGSGEARTAWGYVRPRADTTRSG
jgi:gamma-glutamylcyclotransferase (GGCT)/AIG2-like uncharacterized protein YtfP